MKSILKSVLPSLSLFLLMGCHSSLSDKRTDPSLQNEVVMVDGSNITGIYASDLWPVNYNLHFKKIGAVAVQRHGDNFSATVMMKFGPPDTSLRQAIYSGRRCPNITDDINKDAYIDINEARSAIGQITIPLDRDLDSQLAGQDLWSRSDLSGKYLYQRSGSFERMFNDLKITDENPADDIIKIKEEEGLTLPGRVLIIHGLAESYQLPQSISTIDGQSPHQSIPVACAVLWKVPEVPVDLITQGSEVVIE